MKKICNNCKFWDITEYHPIKEGQIGLCTRVNMFWDSTKWDKKDIQEDLDIRSLVDECKNDKAFVQDGSDYKAELLTLPTFGCNQFEIK